MFYKSQNSSNFGNARRLQELKRPAADNFFKVKAHQLVEEAKQEQLLHFMENDMKSMPSEDQIFQSNLDEVRSDCDVEIDTAMSV